MTAPSKPARAQVYEEHDLSPADYQDWWTDLVDWVAWLHDAYELSTDQRLPECWHQHPGLVRELAALRAWRAEIYTPPRDDAGQPVPVWGNGGSARAWHTELRNVLRAATSEYAVRCRAGHKTPTPLDSAGDLQQQWTAEIPEPIRPPGWTPPASPPGPTSGSGTQLSQAHMHTLLERSQAHVLSPHLPGYVHHAGAWWVTADDQTWLAITDRALSQRLDAAATTWQRAEAAVATRTSTHRPRP